MAEKDSIALVPLTFSEIRTLRGLLLRGSVETDGISQGEKERLVVKLHAALEGVTPVANTTNTVQ